MKDNFDLKKFLKESKAIENLNPSLKAINDKESKSLKENSLKDKIREMIVNELSPSLDEAAAENLELKSFARQLFAFAKKNGAIAKYLDNTNPDKVKQLGKSKEGMEFRQTPHLHINVRKDDIYVDMVGNGIEKLYKDMVSQFSKLEFGNYKVEITAPNDHIVAATGELQNAKAVMSDTQIKRWNEAKKSGEITFIVTPEEAKKNQSKKTKSTKSKTWVFEADNVRDFAWASSRKFIWDAKYHEFSKNKKVWAMSFYPNEAEPLWSKYSTESVAHTLDVFSKFTFDYPYPVAISVNGPVFGMEYPMICFNGPRPEKDGTYSESTKNALIGVVIHEVGHNWFPMIVNSDERQWTWMDEGLTTFLQFLAQAEWQQKWSSGRGKPKSITSYMASSKQRPIMTNSESIHQFGSNAYSKPAAALNVLRETVMGRELFDFAFKEYSRRWMFKRPEPADFFRTMEDASGKDLDWFWRGWFYTTHNVDIGISSLRLYEIDTKNPDIEKPIQKNKRDELNAKDLIDQRNQSISKAVDRNKSLLDFYNKYDPLDITGADRRGYNDWIKGLDPEELKLLSLRKKFYVVEFENIGGLVSPIILNINYQDGKNERIRIPAEIWRKNNDRVSKLIISDKEITQIELDPLLETADTDRHNNFWPPKAIESRFQIQKRKKSKNPMQKAKEEEDRLKKENQKSSKSDE